MVYTMYSPDVKVVDIGRRPLDDYIFDIIVSFREGVNEVILKGHGDTISKAVDLYWKLKDRLGDSIELTGVNIGSERFRGRTKPYIEIRIKRKY